MRFSWFLIFLVGTSSVKAAQPLHFENDILPILGRYGCSSSGCHGKAEGQGNFKLSILGSDPISDWTAIVQEGRGRRIHPAAPHESLLLKKASGAIAHGGGNRISSNHEDFAILLRWIMDGCGLGPKDAPSLVSLRVIPMELEMKPSQSQPLQVWAKFSDGKEKNVTSHARYQSNADQVASVSEQGVVTGGDTPGDAAIMAGYLGEVAVFRVVLPRSGSTIQFQLPQFNSVDSAIDNKLRKLNISPSGLCDDLEFLRRVTIDLTGQLPTETEINQFESDLSINKRRKKVEMLLERAEFADLWALRWADLLRVDREPLGHERAFLYYQWIRQSLINNKPWDSFARELVTAEGPTQEIGPVHFYQAVKKPGDQAAMISQVLLGVRITCAECHHHPFDRWKQADYFGMTAFFSNSAVRHPRTQEVIQPYALGTTMPDATPSISDKRILLAEWMTKPDNPYFARNVANRTWAWLFGRGIVEPVDDVRATNPPSNPELLDVLARQFTSDNYNLKKLILFITSSRVYQASSKPNDSNTKDEQNFSRAYFKRPDAEVLLDMIIQASGVPEKFPGSPDARRAVQLWDSKARHDFLKLFGRPNRVTACECERTHEPSVAQVLNLMNSPRIQAKLSHEGGFVARLSRDQADNKFVIDSLYKRFVSRPPTDQERLKALNYLSEPGRPRQVAIEDLAWALLNSNEFIFNH